MVCYVYMVSLLCVRSVMFVIVVCACSCVVCALCIGKCYCYVIGVDVI